MKRKWRRKSEKARRSHLFEKNQIVVMVLCFVPDCNHNSQKATCRYFRFPIDKAKKNKWISLIRRLDRFPSKSSRVCSCHFVDGNKDNVPELFERNKVKVFPRGNRTKRYKKKLGTEPDDIPLPPDDIRPQNEKQDHTYASTELDPVSQKKIERLLLAMEAATAELNETMSSFKIDNDLPDGAMQMETCHDMASALAAHQEEAMDTAETVLIDDDDVVCTGEDKSHKASAPCGDSLSSESAIASVSCAIQEARDAAAGVAKEYAALMMVELNKMEANLSHSVYRSLKFLADNPSCIIQLPVGWEGLKEMVNSVLDQMREERLLDITRSEYLELQQKFSKLEKENQAVSKKFVEIHSQVKKMKMEADEELAALEKELILRLRGQKNEDSCMLIDSEEEDNGVSYVAPSKQPSQTVPQQSPIEQAQVVQEIPSMEQLRTQFASAVASSMPTLLSSLHQPPQTVPFNTTYQSLQNMQAMQCPAPVKWPELEIGDKVLGKKQNDVWYSGTVMDIDPSCVKDEWKCRVKFDRKGMKWLEGKHVAYKEPINCFVRVGTRVVALYREDDGPSSYYAGVIAEAPSAKNNKRFLVFFDDGYAQYCDVRELHKVYKQSSNVWEDINPETSAFIKDYLRIYPERPMVRLAEGQVVRVEWNGKWWTAKVQATDASLVKMCFQVDKRIEWLYRGSTRLEPLYKALANADAIKAAGTSKGRRHNVNMKPSDHVKPSVEYTRGTDDDYNSPNTVSKGKGNKVETKKKSNVAKKSTGGIAFTSTTDTSSPTSTGKWEPPWTKYQRKAPPGAKRSTSLDSQQQQQQEPRPDSANSNKEKPITGLLNTTKQGQGQGKDIASMLQERLVSSQVEYDEEKATGQRKETSIDITKVRTSYVVHTCSPECVRDSDEDPDKFKGRNALLIPLLCGWERQVCKARPATKRFVLYRAPCGRRLRSMEEVDKYLMQTDSKMLIDLFCFDTQLHVNTEFVPVKTFCDIKDMSYGKENYPISCVNGVDRQYPDYVEYENHRIPTTGVHLNLDPDFLTCCDCTDNCRDKSKCACQQMTVQNTGWIGDINPDAGYQHKHLPEPLFTGIVECNARCKCDKRCLNRVAQLGLKKRLQVFKTGKKGWGLRCLDDIAKGSFICIYAGQLLTDKGANEEGKQFGDEYLAELDFIEVVERQKEGYESDVEQMDFSEDEKDANYKASNESEDDSDYDAGFEPGDGKVRRSSRHRKKKDDAGKSDDSKPTEAKKDVNKDENPESTSNEEPINISDDDPDEDDDCDEAGKAKTENGSGTSNEASTTGGASSTDKKEEREKSRPRAKKSTGGSRFNLSTNIKTGQEPIAPAKTKEEKKECIPTRSFFQDDTDCYIMDAKSMGNLGRYLNHSCSPNVFVQNIFVDTHDLRFPWVAFFAGQYIRAGTELTWDYNYEVGSVPNKVLYCYCGSSTCRGRLL